LRENSDGSHQRPRIRRQVGIVLSEHTADDGATIFLHACKMGLEGIVSKRLSAPYRSGPSRDWIKAKNPDSPAMIRAREVWRGAEMGRFCCKSRKIEGVKNRRESRRNKKALFKDIVARLGKPLVA
jgi:ATP-dependent DNA ligase